MGIVDSRRRKVQMYASLRMELQQNLPVNINSSWSLCTLFLIMTYCASCLIWFHLLTSKYSLLSSLSWKKISMLDNSQNLNYEMSAYYINLKKATARVTYITNHLKEMKFNNIHHVPAWTAEDVAGYVEQRVTSMSNMLKPNAQEIGCIASHLHAMYLAVNDTTNTNPYALIVEDDVRFPFAIDWQAMIEAAPKDFAILQITTSNSKLMKTLWDEYKMKSRQWLRARRNKTMAEVLFIKKPNKDTPLTNVQQQQQQQQKQSTIVKVRHKPPPAPPSLPTILSQNQWMKRSWESEYWSTQGYIIQKAVLRKVINDFVHGESWNKPLTAESHPYITLQPLPQIPCHHRPCLLPFRVVADHYLYAMFQPVYMSRIPLLNGELLTANISTNSFIQQGPEKVVKHIQEFHRIEEIVEEIRQNGTSTTVSSISETMHLRKALQNAEYHRHQQQQKQHSDTKLPSSTASAVVCSDCFPMKVQTWLEEGKVLLPPYIHL